MRWQRKLGASFKKITSIPQSKFFFQRLVSELGNDRYSLHVLCKVYTNHDNMLKSKKAQNNKKKDEKRAAKKDNFALQPDKIHLIMWRTCTITCSNVLRVIM